MALFITSLNSGSNGNCYYVGNGIEGVLVDAGISCREIEKRMANLQLDMQTVKALFISHEHIDHIRGVEVLARRHNLPVYINGATLKGSRLDVDAALVYDFEPNQPVRLGELNVTPFVKQHDAAHPVSFVVEGNGIRVGVFTDIGTACKQVIHYFKQCHACFLESNYDVQMLEEGGYPMHLKNRIRNGHGHLSNNQALELFTRHRPAYMSHLILSHLSKNNNDPDLVLELFTKHTLNTNIVVASRYSETAIYPIGNAGVAMPPLKQYVLPAKPLQMSLFE